MIKSSRPAACPALLFLALPCSVTMCSKTVFLQNVLLLLMSAWALLILQHFCQCPHHTLLSDCCYNTDCHNCLLKQPRCLQLPWPPLCFLSFFVTSWTSSSATVRFTSPCPDVCFPVLCVPCPSSSPPSCLSSPALLHAPPNDSAAHCWGRLLRICHAKHHCTTCTTIVTLHCLCYQLHLLTQSSA